ncbi:hypothetical protein SEPCBS119000_001152 [Sporothrix epigloea]|uniref:C2H2-type domain-containing protein n=1 Tax=Sporothrix epigloea TaxID=1892477 RepID=A0ABP0DC34_9PEZI
MSSPTPTVSLNPRRLPVTRLGFPGSGRDAGLTTSTLRKGATFHSSPGSSLDLNSCFCPPQLSRSQSNLDDVVDAHRRRVALTLDSITKTLASTHISSPKASTDNLDVLGSENNLTYENLPGRLTSEPHTTAEQCRIPQPRSVNHRSFNNHASDSGLGSSIASSSVKKYQQQQISPKSTSSVRPEAVVRSVAAAPVKVEKSIGLSARATNRIYEHTVKPLLANPDYRPLHPILLECTTKINRREIVCLRDLEKAILFMAPVSDLCKDTGVWGNTYWYLCVKEKTKAAQLYLDFSLDSVRCLQATVDLLSEREQTRPPDPPYTAGYFIDLVDQIHHYARQIAEARKNENAGSNNMDFYRYNIWLNTLLSKHCESVSPAAVEPSVLILANIDATTSTKKFKLHGGITVNGRFPEIVGIDRDGHATSFATDLPVKLEEDIKDNFCLKRSASQELANEEEIMRSMARRKKNAPPEEYAPKMCSVPGCTKEFKRPCDLTKHEKTHSRPWKCQYPSCKYFEHGWPTEKERDRHINDKHSSDPLMYECLFKPCTYKSKRDSNRKQHMEKTHGWKYVRTKTSGGGKSAQVARPLVTDERPFDFTDSLSTSLPTPQLLNLLTPQSGQSPAVVTPPKDEFAGPLFSTGLANIDFATCGAGGLSTPDVIGPAGLADFEYTDLEYNQPFNFSSPSTASSLDSNSAYQDLNEEAGFFDDIYSAPAQLPTPENVYRDVYAAGDKCFFGQFCAVGAPALCNPMTMPVQQRQADYLREVYNPSLELDCQKQLAPVEPFPFPAPLGLNAMLCTPDSKADEAFLDGADSASGFGADFILLPDGNESFQFTEADVNGITSNFEDFFDVLQPSMAAGYSQPASQLYAVMPTPEQF